MKKIGLLIMIWAMVFNLKISADDKVTITVVSNACKTVADWFKSVIKDYETAHKDVDVRLMTIPGDDNTYDTKIAMMLNDPGSGIDVIWTGTIFKSLAESNRLSPLPEMKEWSDLPNFVPAVMKENCMFNGEYYAFPIVTDTRGIWYNTKIFKQAGLEIPWAPKTWADIFDACRKIKEKVSGVYPFYFNIRGADEATSMQTAFMLLAATDGKLFKDGKWVVESQGLYDVLKFIDKMYKEKLAVPVPVLFGLSNQAFWEVYPQKDKIAMLLDGNWIYNGWKEKSPAVTKIYDLAALPTEYGQGDKLSTVAGGWIITMSANTKHRKEALDFMKFATSRDELLSASKIIGMLSPRLDVAQMNDYPEEFKKPSALLRYAQFRPINKDYPAISAELSTAVENVAMGKMTAEEAMKNYADNVVRLVGQDKVARESYKTE